MDMRAQKRNLMRVVQMSAHKRQTMRLRTAREIVLILLLPLVHGLASSQTITTIAGNGVGGYSGDGGPATEAQISWPANLAVDRAGNLYFGDLQNNVVRRIDAVTGIITTVAGGGSSGGGLGVSAELREPGGLAFDSAGNLYIAEIGRVSKLDPSGTLSTFAGCSCSDDTDNIDGNLATDVSLRTSITNVAVDRSDNVYISLWDGMVFKVDAAGVVTRVAGRLGSGPIGDGGPAVDANIEGINGIGVDRAGNLYIAQQLSDVIRKVDTNGIITTVAGQFRAHGFSGDGGPASLARIDMRRYLIDEGPSQIVVDIAGNIYFTDVLNTRVRKIDTSGTIYTVAGAEGQGFNDGFGPCRDTYAPGDGGPATSACLMYPEGVALGPDGSLFISDTYAYRIRRVEQPNAALTSTGSSVQIAPTVSMPDGSASTSVELTFDTVLAPGTTVVTAMIAPPGVATPPPNGFQVGESGVYYDVATSAAFAGQIALCFSWEEGQFEDENRIKLFHFENGSWNDVTTLLDTGLNKACGRVSSLSPFGLFEAVPWFSGFFSPVDNVPTRNIVKAGAAVPVKFSMNGYWGVGVIDAGYPASQQIQCATGAPVDVITETVNAGSSSLSYDSLTDRYKYVWKTDKSWANSCRRLQLRLRDGSVHSADFGFTK